MLTEHPLLQASRSGLPSQEELNQARKEACVTRQRLETVRGIAELSQAESTVSRCDVQRGDGVGLIRSACHLSIQLQKQGISPNSAGHFHRLLDQVLRLRDARAAPGSASVNQLEHILAASRRSDDDLSRPVLRLSGSWAVEQGKGSVGNLRVSRAAASQHSNTQDQDPVATSSQTSLRGRRRRDRLAHLDQASSPSSGSGDDQGFAGVTAVRGLPSRGGVSRFFGSASDSRRVSPRAVAAPPKRAPQPASNNASQRGQAHRDLAPPRDTDATTSPQSSEDARRVGSAGKTASPWAGRRMAGAPAAGRQPQQQPPRVAFVAPTTCPQRARPQTTSARNVTSTADVQPLSCRADAPYPVKPTFQSAADKPRRLAIRSYPAASCSSSTSTSPSSTSLTSSSSDLAAGRYPNRMRFRPWGAAQPSGRSRDGVLAGRQRQQNPASGGAGRRGPKARGRSRLERHGERDQGQLLHGDSDSGEEGDRRRVAAVVGSSRADRARGQEPRGSRRTAVANRGRGCYGGGGEVDEEERGTFEEEEEAEGWQRSGQRPGGLVRPHGTPKPYSAWGYCTDELQMHLLTQPAPETRDDVSVPGGRGGSGVADWEGQPPVRTTLWQRRWEQRRRYEQQLGLDSNEGSQQGGEGQEHGQAVGPDGEGGYRSGYRAAAVGLGSLPSRTSPLLKSAVRSAAAAVEAAVMALGGLHRGGGGGGDGDGESSAGSAGSSPLRGSVHMGHSARGSLSAGDVAAGAGWPVSGGLSGTWTARPGSACGSLGGLRGGSRLSLQQQQLQLRDEQGQGQDQGGAHPDLSYLLDSPVGSEGGSSSVASVAGAVPEEAGVGRGRLGTLGRDRHEAGGGAGGDVELMVRSLAEGLGAAAAAHAAVHARARAQQPQQLQAQQPQQPQQQRYPQPQSRYSGSERGRGLGQDEEGASTAQRTLPGQQGLEATAVDSGQMGMQDAGKE